MMNAALQEVNQKYINSQFHPILEKKYRDFSQQELEKKLEFEQELGLFDNMKEIQEELLQETKSITVSLHTKKSIDKYFETIQEQIKKRAQYKSHKNKLNYKLVRRFLWTAFNNLHEIDMHVVTPKILHLSNNLKEMAKVYNDFTRKTKYPALAYDEVFLAKQTAYVHLKKNTFSIVEEIKKLKMTEQYLATTLKKRKKILESSKKSPKYKNLLQEYKKINGTYTDIIHVCSILREKHTQNKKQMREFEKTYLREFSEYFQKTAQVYEKVLIEILGAMAFEFDKLLWESAQKSQEIRNFFEEANIKGEFNTKTYLQYYIESSDGEKASEELEELQEVLNYLNSLYMESILIVTNDTDDAIEFKRSIKTLHQDYDVVSFTDEKLALKWAFQNRVTLLVINETLPNMTLKSFLQYYKKYTLTQSTMLLLGQSKKLPLAVTKTLSTHTTPAYLAKEVQKLLHPKDI